MNTVRGKRGSRGFTLIELMVVIAIIGIFAAIAVPAELHSQRLAESEVALQKAIQLLRGEVELLRSAPVEGLEAGRTLGFDPRAGRPQSLVEGAGEVRVSEASGRPGLLSLEVTVRWKDARIGPRSIHTVVYRAAGGGGK